MATEIQLSTAIGSKNQTESTDSEYTRRKIQHHSHILWLVAFLFNIYDYYTDIEVATSWVAISKSLCPQFNCTVADQKVIRSGATLLIAFSTIGFVAGFIIKLVKAYALVQIYKFSSTKAEATQHDLKNAVRMSYIAWIPLVLENAISLYLVYDVFQWGNVQYVSTIEDRGIYIRSIVMSFVSLCVALALSMRQSAKLFNAPAHEKDAIYTKPTQCHCCWCFLTAAVACMMMFGIVMALVQQRPEPLVSIEAEECRVYNEGMAHPADPGGEYHADGDHVYNGTVLSFPTYVYDQCAGTNYNFDVYCTDDYYANTVKLLHCKLNWVYTEVGMDDACVPGYSNNTAVCPFEIDIDEEQCGNYTIKCGNGFSFFDGDAVMWACFDYCL